MGRPQPRIIALRFWRFAHMLSHVPLGFGEPRWAVRLHDWTAAQWKVTGTDNSESPDSKEAGKDQN
jgi:hypothetical protein